MISKAQNQSSHLLLFAMIMSIVKAFKVPDLEVV